MIWTCWRKAKDIRTFTSTLFRMTFKRSLINSKGCSDDNNKDREKEIQRRVQVG